MKKVCSRDGYCPWHKKTIPPPELKTEMQQEYTDIRKSIKFITTPEYSPDLKQIEQVR